MAGLDRSLSDSWWKYFGLGAAVLALVAIVTTITGDLPDGWWVIAMGTLLFSLLSMALGLVLGVANLGQRRAAR